jgi:hypothetical protein
MRIQWNLKKWGMKLWTGLIWYKIGKSSCESSNGTSDFIKEEKF